MKIDQTSASGKRAVLRSLDLLVTGSVCLAGAAIAASVAGLFISDSVDDWYEVRSPEQPAPGQTMHSYWAEHSALATVFDFGLWFSPSIGLFFLGLRCFVRAAPLLRRSESHAHRSG